MKDLRKIPVFRSPKLLASANGKRCVRCGRQVEGVVACHYTGVRREVFGGGFGTRVSDLIHARMCQDCHVYVDTLSRNKEMRYGHSEEFLTLCAMTLIQLVDEGLLVVPDGRKS
jgi:hypothetical protein